MRIFGMIATLLFGVLMGGPHTLREQLADAGIPQGSFNQTELDALVDGFSAEDNQFTYFVYVLRTKDDGLTGPPEVVRYDTSKGTLLRAEIKLKDYDLFGSPEGIDIVDGFLLLTFHINPSAAMVAVLDSNLKLVVTFGGFGMDRIAPHQVVFMGNMVHFAPTHAEWLGFVDLRYGKVSQFYPSGNDAFRARFIEEHGKHIPSQDLCQEVNDPCDPSTFDEDIAFLGSDGNGHFAIEVDRDASHAPAKGQDPVSVLSESALYLYAHGAKGWVYCEQSISEDEARGLQPRPDQNVYPTVKDRCNPNIPVVPDGSN